MTYREKLQLEHPDKVDPSSMGGCKGCPGSYWFNAPIIFESCPLWMSGPNCTNCWNREIPETEPTKNTMYKKGEKEMEPRNISPSPTATAARETQKQSICDNMSELRKTLTDIYCKTEELARLLFGGECQELPHATPSCLEEDVQMTNELAMAIMNKIVMIQNKV